MSIINMNFLVFLNLFFHSYSNTTCLYSTFFIYFITWKSNCIVSSFFLFLYHSFTCLPTDRITCMKIATVTTNSSTKKTFVIIGLCSFTGLIDNDDCSGSILLFDITTLSPSDTDSPLKPYEIISTKAPVMQLDIMRTEGKEFLVVAKKSRFVYTSSASVSLFDFYDFKESDQFTLTNYISCLVVIKNCILVGDINYGLSFLQYRVNSMINDYYIIER